MHNNDMTIEILTKFKKVVQRERERGVNRSKIMSSFHKQISNSIEIQNNFVYKNFGIVHRGLANGCPLKNKKSMYLNLFYSYIFGLEWTNYFFLIFFVG